MFIASNKYSVSANNSFCHRYDRKETKYKNVPQPISIKMYNDSMDGVGLLNNLVACYRVSFMEGGREGGREGGTEEGRFHFHYILCNFFFLDMMKKVTGLSTQRMMAKAK